MTDYYVPRDGDLRSVLNKAEEGDTVWLKPGEIYPTTTLGPTCAAIRSGEPPEEKPCPGFGFTRDDVTIVTEMIGVNWDLADREEQRDMESKLRSLADRIEALLPPEEP